MLNDTTLENIRHELKLKFSSFSRNQEALLMEYASQYSSIKGLMAYTSIDNSQEGSEKADT